MDYILLYAILRYLIILIRIILYCTHVLCACALEEARLARAAEKESMAELQSLLDGYLVSMIIRIRIILYNNNNNNSNIINLRTQEQK